MFLFVTWFQLVDKQKHNTIECQYKIINLFCQLIKLNEGMETIQRKNLKKMVSVITKDRELSWIYEQPNSI